MRKDELEMMLMKANDEIEKLRREIHEFHFFHLKDMYGEVDSERSLEYFLAVPVGYYKGKDSLEALQECCRVSKIHRDQSLK